jgi:hypothetical protein
MLQSITTRVGASAVVLVCAYAIFAGSWRERFGAFIYLVGYVVVLGFGLASPRYPAVYMLMADALCLPGFFIASWKSPHPWPGWAIFAQLVSVAVDVVTMFGLLNSWIFFALAMAASYGVLLSLLIGTIAYRSRRRRKDGSAG